ncbi:MAG: type II toxin-antitoxin system PemK/MazF family toxin [Verrucomicrobia bacterium]|nr:type II toxin-antitoxin system PemK/MazF family toxin [Verrucomicrobiota bacterium]
MRRGDIVVVAAPGDYGKPRPAVVVQADALTESGIASVILCLLSSTLVEAPLIRLTVELTSENGLRQLSQIMVDKLFAVSHERITGVIGRINDEQLLRLNRMLAFVVGIG